MLSGTRFHPTLSSHGRVLSPFRAQHHSRRWIITAIHPQPQRISALWIPTGGFTGGQGEDAHAKLIHAGFLRQSHSGIFHLLPLGLRVQDKVEALLDYHMSSLGASRISLSSITSKDMWEQSGRYSQVGSELFNFQDRKGAQYMLSPTHEEEVTALVSRCVKSYKELPLRLYQITRKYRDELRPRHGLLRTREFTMKDLYTFDVDMESALSTYDKVQAAYADFFAALKLPFVKARAGSGDMGGNLSHEYHLPTPVGEDIVAFCDQCNYAANAEVAESRASKTHNEESAGREGLETRDGVASSKAGTSSAGTVQEGDGCPSCDDGKLKVKKALEVGHTFHLGTRYSEPMGAWVSVPPRQDEGGSSPSTQRAPIQMGCHGVGVSRLIGAVAEHMSDGEGLQWPRVVAPYEVNIVFPPNLAGVAEDVYYSMRGVDAVLDDRAVSLPWKLKDADLIGYPVVIVLGKAWKENGQCEIQCRRLGVKTTAAPEDVPQMVADLLGQL